MAPISPHTYERLETGDGRGSGRRDFRQVPWRKILVGGAILITLIYLFAPLDKAKNLSSGWSRPQQQDSAIVDDDGDSLPAVTLSSPKHIELKPPGVEKPTINDPLKHIPTSPETDPDKLGTVHCTAPHPANKNIVQYAIMIDAGSTGSRVHIYKFHNCNKAPTYEYEVFKMIQPGLSSYKDDPTAAAKSLDSLLEKAVQTVPESLRKCTPVAVKATAGLRLLGKSQSDAILNAVRDHLQQNYPFSIPGQDAVVIMDGKDEGVYAWITANYLLDTIRPTSSVSATPYAVLDLGGASTQIVFEPKFAKPDTSLVDGEHKYDLTFGGKTRTLYQHSYLGYGLMRARRSVHRLVDFMATFNVDKSHNNATLVSNPCLSKGTERSVEIEDETTGKKKTVLMKGGEVGSFEACNRIVELVMAKDAICEVKPCSFNGVYQPSLMDTFSAGKVLLLSYFYDRISPLVKADAPMTVSSIADLAKDVCGGRQSWLTRWKSDKNAIAELEGRPEYCLDLTFMHGLLRLGYEFESGRSITIKKAIQDTELGWCLGATIALVGGSLTCRI